MREIGRQCPRVQLILHQCCSRCLVLCVMRNLAAKQEQRLYLPSLCAVRIMSILPLTQEEEHVFSHVPCCQKYIWAAVQMYSNLCWRHNMLLTLIQTGMTIKETWLCTAYSRCCCTDKLLSHSSLVDSLTSWMLNVFLTCLCVLMVSNRTVKLSFTHLI